MDNTQQNKTRIARITVGRVHNLGNYENVRYEVTVDVGTNDNPAEILRELETTLSDLRANSGVASYELKAAKEILATPEDELTDWNKTHLDTYKQRIADVEAAQLKREQARQNLAKFGGSGVYTDHKDNWEED